MQVLARISKEGMVVGTIPCTDDTEVLLCSQAARAVLVERLEAINGRCNKCGLVARSEELVEGHCVATIGCGVDSDIQEVLAVPGPMQILVVSDMMERAVVRMVERAAKAISGGAEGAEVEEATPEKSPSSRTVEDAGDVLRDW